MTMTTTNEAITAALIESLSDTDTGPLSDTPYVRAEVNNEGGLDLFMTEDEEAWAEAAIDIPQLANVLADALAAVPAPTEADREALEWWKKFSDRLAEQMSESWDGDEAQEEIIEQFVKRYGALDCLIDALDYEGEVDDVVRIEFDRSTFQWSIAGVAPKTQDGEAREALARTVAEVTELWPEPLDEVHDIPQIVNAILTRYTLVPVSPEGGE